MTTNKSGTDNELEQIKKSAERLGIELDETALKQWLTAITSSKQEGDVVFDERTGVFGHKVSMLDFSPDDLSHFRKLGKLVEFLDIPGKVETALALSGSAAQSKIQTYPGDADYFERVNIIADTRGQACQILAEIIQDKALKTSSGPSYQLMEVRFGSYPKDVILDGKAYPAGESTQWGGNLSSASPGSAVTQD